LTLESFHPKELGNFDKFLRIKANELNTWEHWALAYIVGRGCGDDAFDYFNEDPQLEEFYYLAEQVYESKTSDLMRPVNVKSSKLTGRKWDEGNLQIDFPAICKLFDDE
jgi:hypothetical protein